MGGPRSGNWYRWDKKSLTMEQKQIDIRWLKKQNYLQPGTSGSLSWSCNGESSGYINYVMEQDKMILQYRYRIRGEEWSDVEETVKFDRTPCNFGGDRKWFLCPRCFKRIAILYGAGKYFLCRHCYDLTYDSCNTNSIQRIFDKATKLKEQLGGRAGMAYPIPDKPKGMHWKTYYRIRKEILRLECAGDDAMFKKWGNFF